MVGASQGTCLYSMNERWASFTLSLRTFIIFILLMAVRTMTTQTLIEGDNCFGQ